MARGNRVQETDVMGEFPKEPLDHLAEMPVNVVRPPHRQGAGRVPGHRLPEELLAVATDWRALLAALFEANEQPQDWSFPHGDAGGMDALVPLCAFCGHDDGHAESCPWEAARRALV